MTIDPSAIREKPEAPFQEARQSVDLSQAERIVAVGRGIKGQEHLPVVEKLAAAIGAELAASRPICDAGWLPMERQVGSSGQTVAPKLYLAVGISGAIQHLVGMKGSGTIAAINKDPDAPIFEVADYGIVGDLFEMVPAIVEALKTINRGHARLLAAVPAVRRRLRGAGGGTRPHHCRRQRRVLVRSARRSASGAFVLDVLLQRQTIRERPVVGAVARAGVLGLRRVRRLHRR